MQWGEIIRKLHSNPKTDDLFGFVFIRAFPAMCLSICT